MSSKKLKIMSVSVEPKMHELLHATADKLRAKEVDANKKSRISASKVVRDLVEKHLPLMVPEGDKIPVILEIPVSLKGNEDGLRQWLAQKIEIIINQLV